MKVVWLVDFPLPTLAKELGLASQASGSWVSALLHALLTQPTRLPLPEMTILCSVTGLDKPQCVQIDGVQYRALPRTNGKAMLAQALDEIKPDLVQLFGTESEQALWLFELFDARRILVYIQGLAGPCGDHMTDGLPEHFLHHQPMKEFLSRHTGGLTVLQQKELLLCRGEREKAILTQARQVLGRTDWDRRYCTKLSPWIRYHTLNEIMRPSFYSGSWNRNECQQHRIFVSQGNLPLKGLHRAIAALPWLCSQWPDTQLYVAGWAPPNKGALLQPFMNWLVEYSGYLEKLARHLGVWEHIHYTGVLNESEMYQQMLLAETFLMPSSIENSPNSLGEAMLMGLPSVASAVGGIPSVMSDVEGVLFDPDRPGALEQAIARLWQDPQAADHRARFARERALVDHDPARIANQQLEIYEQLSRL